MFATIYKERIGVSELANIASKNKPTCYRDLKAFSGTTPLEFNLLECIANAKQLLTDPALNVSEVGYSTGFNNLNHFIRHFKCMECITPKAFMWV